MHQAQVEPSSIVARVRQEQAGHADHLAEAKPGQDRADHLTGRHDRERDPGLIPADQRMELGVDQARAAGLDLHACSP
jgi:hypothetical protein